MTSPDAAFGPTVSTWIDHIQSSGRYIFTREEVLAATANTEAAVAASLRRLRKAGRIVSPRRGFHVVVPLEYRTAGAPPADWSHTTRRRFSRSSRTCRPARSPSGGFGRCRPRRRGLPGLRRGTGHPGEPGGVRVQPLAKLEDRDFRTDIVPPLAPGFSYDVDEAAAWVATEVLPRLS